MALLQLALNDTIYLLDIPALITVLETRDWELFGERFFCSNTVTVVGMWLKESAVEPGLTDHHTTIKMWSLKPGDLWRQIPLQLLEIQNLLTGTCICGLSRHVVSQGSGILRHVFSVLMNTSIPLGINLVWEAVPIEEHQHCVPPSLAARPGRIWHHNTVKIWMHIHCVSIKIIIKLKDRFSILVQRESPCTASQWTKKRTRFFFQQKRIHVKTEVLHEM